MTRHKGQEGRHRMTLAQATLALVKDHTYGRHIKYHPDCKVWERYSIPAMDPDTRKRVPMDGIGCKAHGVFLSWATDRPMPL